MNTRGPFRRMNRGSSIGKARPSKVRSSAIPSFSVTTTRKVCKGSTISMRIGPTLRSMRSMLRIRLACRQRSLPSLTIETWASATFSAGYTP